MRVIDDADWKNSIEVMKQLELNDNDKNWLSTHEEKFDWYLKNRTPMAFGMSVSDEYYEKYIELMKGSKLGIGYLEYSAAIGNLTLDEILNGTE